VGERQHIFLTGATGFIGGRLAEVLVDRNYRLTLTARRQNLRSAQGNVVMGALDGNFAWSSALEPGQVVVHAAARAHITADNAEDPVAEFRKVNVEGTLNLAWQAAKQGVSRFIFLSSIGVNGCINERPFTEDGAINPAEPYAKSKSEAEQGLVRIAESTGMEVVIIRPPLVYGPNAPGNFGSLVRWVDKGVPLPLGVIHNKRSLIALDNLIDLIITCIDHPAAANQVFLASDGEDLSTTELLQGVANAMGKPSRLIPIPAGLLMLGATVLGRKAMAQRLLGSLQVDISKARNLLGWQPPLSVEEGLKRCFPEQ